MNGILLAGGVGTGVVVGGVFGARHALEADHVAAVATLVENDNRPITTGASWGVGHSLPILLLGAVFLALDLRVPGWVATSFEFLVATVLVFLGLRVLAGRDSLGLTALRHTHGEDDQHASGGHLHVALFDRRLGLTHVHADETSLAVGVVHGLAGSGGVVVALAAASPTTAHGAAFLVGFSLASVAAMGVASWTWSRVVSHARKLQIAAGLASVLVGVLLAAELVGVGLPL
ncbi:MAG: high-affinity nickel-transporter protein [Halobacteriota archaeon]